MALINQDIEFWAGDTVNIKIVLPPPLSNPTGVWKLAQNSLSPALVTKTLDASHFAIQSDGNWALTIPLVEADTDRLPGGVYYHQARVSDDDASDVTTTGACILHATI